MLTSASLQWITTIGAVCMALLVIAVRLRAAKKPTNTKKILIPPFGMSTGFLMFLFPETHVPFTYAAVAFCVGLLFAFPLISTSKFEVEGDDIYLKRSRAFVFILLGLLVLRMALHSVVERYISLPQSGAVFFILAFGMILPWRLAMFQRYNRVRNTLANAR